MYYIRTCIHTTSPATSVVGQMGPSLSKTVSPQGPSVRHTIPCQHQETWHAHFDAMPKPSLRSNAAFGMLAVPCSKWRRRRQRRRDRSALKPPRGFGVWGGISPGGFRSGGFPPAGCWDWIGFYRFTSTPCQHSQQMSDFLKKHRIMHWAFGQCGGTGHFARHFSYRGHPSCQCLPI